MKEPSPTAELDNDLRMVAIDLLDEILAEERDALNGIEEEEHFRAQAGALAQFGEGHDPKVLARALIISIADQLSIRQLSNRRQK